jgi:hypothetical protein
VPAPFSGINRLLEEERARLDPAPADATLAVNGPAPRGRAAAPSRPLPSQAERDAAAPDPNTLYARVGSGIARGVRGLQQQLEAGRLQTAADELEALAAMRAGAGVPIRLQQRGIGANIARYHGDDDARDARIAELEEWIGERAGRSAEITQAEARAYQAPTTAAFLQAPTFEEAWAAFRQDPAGILTDVGVSSFVQAAPGLAAGGVVAGAAGLAGGAAMTGASSAFGEYGSSIIEALADAGVDTSDPAALAAAVRNPGVLEAARHKARTRAAIVGGADALSFGLAGRTARAVVGQPAASLGRRVARVIGETGRQGALGAGGEAGAQLATEGKIDAPGEVLAEALGETVQTPGELAGAVAGERAQAGPTAAGPAVEPTATAPPPNAPEERPPPAAPPDALARLRALMDPPQALAPAAELSPLAMPEAPAWQRIQDELVRRSRMGYGVPSADRSTPAPPAAGAATSAETELLDGAEAPAGIAPPAPESPLMGSLDEDPSETRNGPNEGLSDELPAFLREDLDAGDEPEYSADDDLDDAPDFDQYLRGVAVASDDADEVAGAIALAREVTAPGDPAEIALAEELEAGTRIDPASLDEYTGSGMRGATEARRYTRRGGATVEALVEAVNQMVPEELAMEPADVVAFLQRYPEGAGQYRQSLEHPALRRLEQRYQELTGKKWKPAATSADEVTFTADEDPFAPLPPTDGPAPAEPGAAAPAPLVGADPAAYEPGADAEGGAGRPDGRGGLGTTGAGPAEAPVDAGIPRAAEGFAADPPDAGAVDELAPAPAAAAEPPTPAPAPATSPESPDPREDEGAGGSTVDDVLRHAREGDPAVQVQASLGPVPDAEAERVRQATGLDVRGFERRVSSFGVRHALKRHGPESNYVLREGQPATTEDDFRRVGDYIAAAESVERVELRDANAPGIKYTTRENGHVVTVEAVFDSRKRGKGRKLVVWTIYKRRAGPGGGPDGGTAFGGPRAAEPGGPAEPAPTSEPGDGGSEIRQNPSPPRPYSPPDDTAGERGGSEPPDPAGNGREQSDGAMEPAAAEAAAPPDAPRAVGGEEDGPRVADAAPDDAPATEAPAPPDGGGGADAVGRADAGEGARADVAAATLLADTLTIPQLRGALDEQFKVRPSASLTKPELVRLFGDHLRARAGMLETGEPAPPLGGTWAPNAEATPAPDGAGFSAAEIRALRAGRADQLLAAAPPPGGRSLSPRDAGELVRRAEAAGLIHPYAAARMAEALRRLDPRPQAPPDDGRRAAGGLEPGGDGSPGADGVGPLVPDDGRRGDRGGDRAGEGGARGLGLPADRGAGARPGLPAPGRAEGGRGVQPAAPGVGAVPADGGDAGGGDRAGAQGALFEPVGADGPLDVAAAVRPDPARAGRRGSARVGASAEPAFLDPDPDAITAVEPVADGRIDVPPPVQVGPLASPAPRPDADERRRAQAEASALPVALGDRASIDRTLPFLFDEQREDVEKAERRFFGNDPQPDAALADPRRGILFTNGTGTGKTYTGLGIIARSIRAGRPNVLVVVPTEQKVNDWIADGRNVGVELVALTGITDAGKPQAVTTYANFAANEALRAREWDLVVYDESHRLMQNLDGTTTGAVRQHQLVTNHPDHALYRLVGEVPKVKAALKAVEARRAIVAQATRGAAPKDAELERLQAEYAVAYHGARTDASIVAAAAAAVERTKAVFLSATPFAYHKNLAYADGYLFQSPLDEGSGGYNTARGFDAFLQQNLGYGMRTGKLNRPEVGVDQGLMERDLHGRLERAGAVSGRVLSIDQDYSRDFFRVDSNLGYQIDEGMRWVFENHKEHREISEAARERWNHLYKTQLLESLKAREVTGRVRQHLELGRKVIVFHSYNAAHPAHPFQFGQGGPAEAFAAARPDLVGLDLSGLANAIDTITGAFPGRSAAFNGTVPKKERAAAVRRFNDDDSGLDVLVVQLEAGKEGISLHDTTGAKPRVVMTLALPTKPTDAIQAEGRAYRVGNKSNAVFEYPVTGLAFEASTFGQKVATRAKTAENLALGAQARDLEAGFRDGYANAATIDPGPEQGRGGRDGDRAAVRTSPFQRAKSYYYARQKRTSRDKSREGVDYFATPEPVGFKLVEWLGLAPGMDMLEPSAGHGAIARFTPDGVRGVFVEPSYELAAQLELNTNGTVRREGFEDLHVSQKFDGVAMNPPFGSGGRTAVDHVAKAAKHLRDGGRIVAIIPRGPAADAKFDKWYHDDAQAELVLVASLDLPAVTFGRAGTSVATRVVVLDRVADADRRASHPTRSPADLSAGTIEELFDRLEHFTMPDPVRPVKAEAEPGAAPPAAGLELVAGAHTKHGYPIWTARLVERVERETYQRLSAAAQLHGGYFSSYRGGGAVPGFVFREEAKAQAFMAWAGAEADGGTARGTALLDRPARGGRSSGFASRGRFADTGPGRPTSGRPPLVRGLGFGGGLTDAQARALTDDELEAIIEAGKVGSAEFDAIVDNAKASGELDWADHDLTAEEEGRRDQLRQERQELEDAWERRVGFPSALYTDAWGERQMRLIRAEEAAAGVPAETGDGAPTGDGAAPTKETKKAPAGADTGLEFRGAAGAVPVDFGGDELLRPMEMPELVRLARLLMGDVPHIRKLRKSNGLFKPGAGPNGRGAIVMREDLFRDPVQATRTLAHEIGHLVDFLGTDKDGDEDNRMDRGNLLGRLLTLRRHMATTAEADSSRGGAITPEDRRKLKNDAIRDVLKARGRTLSDYIGDPLVRSQLATAVNAEYKRLLDLEISQRRLIENKPIQEELWALSTWWRPMPTDADDAYTAYRRSAVELYADALSVLLNDPATLEAKAPRFFAAFMEHLGRKPDVQLAYEEAQLLLAAGPEAVLQTRLASVYEMEEEGEKRKRLLRETTEARRKGEWRTQLVQALVTRWHPILVRAREAERSGAPWSAADDPRYLLEEIGMADGRAALLLADVGERVLDPMKKAGLAELDLGAYLFLNRVAREKHGAAAEEALSPEAKEAYDEAVAGAEGRLAESEAGGVAAAAVWGRAVMANPRGFTEATALATLEHMATVLGPERFAVLEASAREFADLTAPVLEEAAELGVYNREVFEKVIRPNRYTYASFRVLDFIEHPDYVSAGIKAGKGTFRDIDNPFEATLLKTLSLVRANIEQRGRLSVKAMMERHFPAEWQAAPLAGPGRYQPPKGALNGEVWIYQDGRRIPYHTDPYIAEAFKHTPLTQWRWLAVAMRWLNAPFRAGFITYNLTFALFTNPIRDARRLLKTVNLKGKKKIGYAELVGRYVTESRAAWAYARGRVTHPKVRPLLAEAVLLPPGSSTLMADRNDGLRQIAERYGMAEPIPRSAAMRALYTVSTPVRMLARGVKLAGRFTEALPKFAGYRMLTARGVAGVERAGLVRDRIGTPNVTDGGTQRELTNSLFMFSNVFTQGWRADLLTATDPQTRAGFWYRTLMLDVVPKLAMKAALMGVLAKAVAGALGVDEDDEEENIGAWLKRFYEHVGRYDLTNYLVIPLGYKPDEGSPSGRQAVYLRIPHDETGRALGGELWTLMNSPSMTRALTAAFDYGGGQIPGFAPAIELGGQWAEYLGGGNPRDDFRQREIIGRNEQAARAAGDESAAFVEMLHHTQESFGTGRGVPFVNRVVRAGARGLEERERDAEASADGLRASVRNDYGPRTVARLREYRRIQNTPEEHRTERELERYAQLSGWHTQTYGYFDELAIEARRAGDRAGEATARAELEVETVALFEALDRAAPPK